MGLIYSKADGGTEPPPMPNFASIGAAASAALKREKVSSRGPLRLVSSHGHAQVVSGFLLCKHNLWVESTLTAEAGCDRVRQGERAASIKNHAPSCFPSM
eukprot:1157304-Pelagomonas_calceolata.AAC.7